MKHPEAHFFLAPEIPLHRQYETLRAYFVDQCPGPEAARRFAYSPGAFRVLCHQFRHDPAKRAGFFQSPRHGPQSAPVRDRVRSLAVLMREEGFARLPRRRDDERPATIKPEAAAVADVRELDLSPRSFRTRVGGLFLFVPLLHPIDFTAVVRHAQLPGSKPIPAEHALRSLLALKLIGKERKSHVMDLVFDQGLAVFAGLHTCINSTSRAFGS